MGHWRDLTWFPLWYNGIPYQNTYPPLLHWCVALIAWVRGISPAHAHHWTTALASSAWLMADVARDMGSAFRPRRLHALVYWGEGPHVSAMTLLPVAFL